MIRESAFKQTISATCRQISNLGSLLAPKHHVALYVWEFSKIWGTLFGGPHNKDPTI